jgi:hypothetical protein
LTVAFFPQSVMILIVEFSGFYAVRQAAGCNAAAVTVSAGDATASWQPAFPEPA